MRRGDLPTRCWRFERGERLHGRHRQQPFLRPGEASNENHRRPVALSVVYDVGIGAGVCRVGVELDVNVGV